MVSDMAFVLYGCYLSVPSLFPALVVLLCSGKNQVLIKGLLSNRPSWHGSAEGRRGDVMYCSVSV